MSQISASIIAVPRDGWKGRARYSLAQSCLICREVMLDATCNGSEIKIFDVQTRYIYKQWASISILTVQVIPFFLRSIFGVMRGIQSCNKLMRQALCNTKGIKKIMHKMAEN